MSEPLAAGTGPVVLLVDDDPGIRRTVAVGLELEGFRVIPASGGRAALAAAETMDLDVVLLDLGMPDLGGLEVLEQLRGRGDDVPVCVLSARDDYVVKPFALEEVVARLHALLRRRPPGADTALKVGGLELLPAERVARRQGRDLCLTRREFELLHLFARHPGEVLERKQLHEEIWGYTWDPGTNVADVFVGYLRRKLEAEDEPRLLHTVRGIGFVLRP